MAGVVIVKPGMLTTVQDHGRWGHQGSGVPVAGPMVPVSHRIANRLLGNDDDAATLEVTLIGPELLFEEGAVVAVCGADQLEAFRLDHGAERIEYRAIIIDQEDPGFVHGGGVPGPA